MNLLRNLGPKGTHYYVAFSGGVDSVVLVHVLLQKGYKLTLVNIDHLDDWSKKESVFTIETAERYGLDYLIRSITRVPEYGESKEAIWSRGRDYIFQHLDSPVVVGHHLDDAVEGYVMNTLGQGKAYILDYKNKNIIRPLILVKKKKIVEYARKHDLAYLSDPTNQDNNFNLRNKVRNSLLPEIMKVFPGVQTTVKKLLITKLTKDKEHG